MQPIAGIADPAAAVENLYGGGHHSTGPPCGLPGNRPEA
jgi:hypothetical protein